MILPTMPMMRYKRWDVVVTAFPFADSGAVKKRPALCIAALAPTRSIQLYWVLMITSTELKGWRGDIEIRDLKKTGLPIPSIIRAAKIACVDKSMIQKRVGVLDATTRTSVEKAVREQFLA